MNKKAILLGMLLGDGCLKTKTHVKQDGSISKYYEYVIAHSVKQEEYLEYKKSLFHSAVGGKLPKTVREPRTDSKRFSRCHKSFRLLHKLLYSNNDKKYFTRKVLDYLTPETIAIWYMDDGCLTCNKNKFGRVSSYEMRIYTYFSEIEAETVREYFLDVWGISPKKRKYNKTGQFNIVFNTSESKKLEALIQDFIIESMRYKLPTTIISQERETSERDDDIV